MLLIFLVFPFSFYGFVSIVSLSPVRVFMIILMTGISSVEKQLVRKYCTPAGGEFYLRTTEFKIIIYVKTY